MRTNEERWIVVGRGLLVLAAGSWLARAVSALTASGDYVSRARWAVITRDRYSSRARTAT